MGSIHLSQSKLWPVLVAVLGASGGACGGSSSGEPLVSGEVSGSYDGASFTMNYGFAIEHNAAYLIALGSSSINCSTIDAPDPPSGDTAAVSASTLAPGSYPNVPVQLYHNITAFTGTGSNAGQLTITQRAPTVVGTIAYSDTISNKSYALNGTFEVIMCP